MRKRDIEMDGRERERCVLTLGVASHDEEALQFAG